MKTAPAAANELPKTMRAAQGRDYGDVDEMISVEDGVKVPRLSDLDDPKKRRDWMVLKTHAVALAPGDCRVLSGKTRELQGPPSFPYVPCGDAAGVVVELPDDAPEDLPFRVGDRVAARFVEGPRGALGEYSLVSTQVADKIPDGISFDEAAALVSASPATVLAERIREGEKVLVLGAGGGIGAHFCQLLRRDRNAGLVVGVSKEPKVLLEEPISCHEAVDYTREDVFEMEKYRDEKFDVVVDLAGYGYSRLEDCASRSEPLVVRTASEGGRFLTMVPPVGPIFEAHTWWQIMCLFTFPILRKALSSRTWNRWRLPKYTFAFSLPSTRDCVTRTFELAKENRKLRAVVDPRGPFPLTTDGVRAAFRVQEGRHVRGKVVVHVADDD